MAKFYSRAPILKVLDCKNINILKEKSLMLLLLLVMLIFCTLKKKRSVTYLLSCEEDPDLLVDKVTDCFMDLTHQEVREFSVFSFQHANVVWRVDNAIAGDFLLEFPSMISVESIEVVTLALPVLGVTAS